MFHVAACLVWRKHTHHARLGMRKIEMDFGMVAEGRFAVLTENDVFIGALDTRIATGLF